MAKKSALLIFGLFSAFTIACDQNYTTEVDGQSTYQEDDLCFTFLDDSLYTYEQSSIPILLEEESTSETDYWSEWVLKTETNPVLTKNFSDNYFGVGWWQPDGVNSTEEERTAEEWLMDHGLMFSVGFGDKQDGKPRFRLDYLWHDEHQDNLMMQVEVPF